MKMAIQSITLTDSSAGSSAKILTGFGFNCYSFQAMHHGRLIDVLWSAANFISSEASPSGSGIPILFPYPGRIRGTTFHWEGRRYELPEGDGRGNAIHGLVLNRSWRIVDRSSNRLVGQFQASVDQPRLLASWPADFQITVEYELEGNTLNGTYRINNPSESPLPFGLGLHPYFRLPLGSGSDAAACEVRVPVFERWELVDMHVTGKRLPLKEKAALHSGLTFGETALDDVFTGMEAFDGRCTTSIHDPGSGLRMVMTFGDTFGHCVVYNPPHREAICIEPYTCVPDAFRLSGEGIDAGARVLAAGESFEVQVGICLESASSV